MRERTIEKHLIKRAKACGGDAFKTVSPGFKGFPDRLVCIPHRDQWGVPSYPRVFLVETKAPKGKLSEVQKRAHARIRNVGGAVYTVYTKEEVDAFFDF